MANVVYTVDLGNGHVADIEGPEGATPEQLQAFVQQNPDAAKPQGYSQDANGRLIVDVPGPETEQKQPEQSTGQQILSGLGAGVRDIGGGAGQLLNLATSPIKAALNALGLPGGDTDYEKVADHIADQLGLSKTAPVQQAIQRGIVSGLLTAGGASGVAGAAKAGGALESVANSLASTPLINAAATGAGEGSGEIAKEAGAGPLGQTLASLAGGGIVAAVPSLASLATRTAAELASPLTAAGARDKAASLLQKNATDTEQALQNIASRPAPVAGVQPTLAEVAGDTGLAGFQRGYNNGNPQALAAVSDRHANNALARGAAVNEALGDGSAQAVQDFGQRQTQRGNAQVANRVSDAEANLSGSQRGVGETADREATGSAARQNFQDAYDAARARTREAYSVPVLQKPQPIKIPQAFFDRLKAEIDTRFGDGGGLIDPTLKDILNDVSEDLTTTRTLTNIDRRLADYAGSAQMAGNRSQAAFANSVRGDLEAAANQVAPPAYREALQNAKALRAEQGRVFETGDVSKAFNTDRFGNPIVGNTEVPTRLLRPGSQGGDTADRLIASLGQADAEGLVRQEFQRVLDSGPINTEAQAIALQNRYADTLQRFPDLQRDLANIRQHAAALDTIRNSDEAALGNAIQSSPLARLASPDQDATSFIRRLLGKDDGGRQIKTLYGQIASSKDAVAGFRRALGDYIDNAGISTTKTAAGQNVPQVSGTRKAIANVLSRAGDALTPQQRMVLKMVGKELEGTEFAFNAARPAGSPTILNNTIANQVASHIPGVKKAKFLYNVLVDTLGNGQQVKEFINQAILDPDFAATLLKRPTERHWIQAQAALRSRNAAASIRLPMPANDSSAFAQPSLAANPQQQSDQGGDGNAQQ